MKLYRVPPATYVVGCIAAAVVLLCSATARAQSDESVIVANTEPSKRAKLSFNGLGIIEKVAVREGDAVKAGQLIMEQDAEIERLEYERAKAEAESNARIEAAQADLDVKKKTYERKSTAGPDVYNQAEIEEAELDVTFRLKQLEIAKMDVALNKIKAQQTKARLDRMQLFSEFDGFVERIEVHEGEVTDPSRPAVIVVKNDPMYVIIRDLRTSQVAQLKVGDSLQVRYRGEGQNAWRPAKIWYISPVADAASATQVVKAELPNPEKRATGLEVEVKLPDRVAEAGQVDKTASR